MKRSDFDDDKSDIPQQDDESKAIFSVATVTFCITGGPISSSDAELKRSRYPIHRDSLGVGEKAWFKQHGIKRMMSPAVGAVNRITVLRKDGGLLHVVCPNFQNPKRQGRLC